MIERFGYNYFTAAGRLENTRWRFDAERVAWLVGALALVLAPQVVHVPAWVSLSFAFAALWRVAATFAGVRLPGRWMLLVLSVALTGGVALSYGSVFGRDAGVALLVCLTGLKLLETRDARDAFVLLCLGFFLVVSNFLYTQSIPIAFYMFAVVLLLLAGMVALSSDPGEVPATAKLRFAALLVVQSLPVMLVLFVLFPRIDGPLWGLPKDAFGGVTGLSDHMTPGGLTHLGLSDAVAFRVKFDGPIPAQRDLYWRGPVLWDTNGRTWSATPRRTPTLRAPPAPVGPAVGYTVTLEPTHQRWLIALDMPRSAPPGARLTTDYQLLTRTRISERRRYHLVSYPALRPQRLSAAARRRALALPAGAHPRARALARRWRSEIPDDAALVAHALAWFHDLPFRYTLDPPPLVGDTVDDFLFRTRSGFCEYYAAAFAVLMRAAGIPARVVTGFQGGVLNPVGDYLVVRDRDAHAWVEVWLAGRGWVREDPTAAVDPARIERGVVATIPETGAAAVFAAVADAPVLDALRRIAQVWDAANNAWNQWVLGYDAARQNRLLAALGYTHPDWRWLALGLAALVGVLLTVLALWLSRSRRGTDPLARAYTRLCAKLEAVGLARRPGEGPRDFARRAARARPDLSAEISTLIERYLALRYAGRSGDPAAFERAVRRWRPGARAAPAPPAGQR